MDVNFNFNPPSPCGEGRRSKGGSKKYGGFQSTLPMRGGTPSPAEKRHQYGISIHPPHAGRDRQAEP